MIAVVFMLFRWYLNSELRREKKQAKIILTTISSAIIIGGITDILFPILEINTIPYIGVIIIIIPILGIWYSIKKYRLMDLNPENFAFDVLKIMKEGLIIANHNGIIKDINKGALKLLGYEKSQLVNKDLISIFSETAELSKVSNCSSFETELVKSNDDKTAILLSSSILKDEWGDSLGIVCIFQDISEIKLVQQKLRVSYEELEIKVTERTIQLIDANKDLEHKINMSLVMEEEIKQLAYYDYLTGLPNRRLFNDKLNHSILDADQNKYSLGVLFLDLDSFKRINDTMGHSKGDELLKMIAKRLTNILSEEDTICRVGGDEFLILINNIENVNYINKILEKLLNTFKEPFAIDHHHLYMTASIGAAIYPIDGLDIETLIKNADIAMYIAKDEGKNRFALCTTMIKDNITHELQLTNSLYHALDRNELELYYQPQVEIITGEIIGLEALIRWNHKDLGLVNPINFIYIAEKTGLILPIGEWVIRSACIQNKKWQVAGILSVPIAVNISINQFQNTNMVEVITKIIKETDLEPRYLEIEITENIIMKETEYIIESLNQLKQIGIKISIDDFGTEYSSLNYIKQLPIDRIKIDMSFIKGINKNIKDEAIIKVIIVLAKNLGLKVIAEGVEAKDQLDFLRDQMCDDIQGYYFYKPMPFNLIEELMNNYKLNVKRDVLGQNKLSNVFFNS